MNKLSFRRFFESKDIFGFETEKEKDQPLDPMLMDPIKTFDVELMIELLSKKKIGAYKPVSDYMNEIRWGSQPGAIKLEVDTGYGFLFKKLGTDKQGNPRWYTKRIYQLNRNGYGGMEDSVAQEVYENLERFVEGGIDAPQEEYSDLDSLVRHIYSKMRRNAKIMFIPENIKKLNDNAYLLCFGVRGHGLEFRNQQRVEQNQTLVSYDESQGTIRICNYNLLSKVGGPHEFKISQNDLDLYFFPSQSRDEIADAVATFMKFY